MTASITTPFPIFTDRNGQPLDGGFIYIGTANLNPITNPVSIFWDAALTIPAAQPVRTSGGYAVNNGAASVIYTLSDFSITVCDKNNTPLYTAPSYTFRVNSAAITFGAVIVDTSIVPDAAGGAFNGTIALPWSSTVSRTMQARTLTVYDQTQPVVAADLTKINQLKSVCFLAKLTAIVGPSVDNGYNASGAVTRTGPGVFTIGPTVALPASRFCFGTVETNDPNVSVVVSSTTTLVTVRVFIGITPTDGSTVSIVVFGNPAVADPIS